MKLKPVRLTEEYRPQLEDMMTEWTASGEHILPAAIRRHDFRDFEGYINELELTEERDGLVPATTLFCLDEERNIFVGAVDIRHYLNDGLLFAGGHIGDGVRPSERRKGIATKMIVSGVPVTTIANVLGQLDIESSKQYLSFDTENLRECALSLKGIEMLGGESDV